MSLRQAKYKFQQALEADGWREREGRGRRTADKTRRGQRAGAAPSAAAVASADGTVPGMEGLDHGSVVVAAITSCTNTSNPSVMIGAGLLARNAVKRGLKVKPWVKTSLAPGSLVVTEYLQGRRPARVSRRARASTSSAMAARPASATAVRCPSRCRASSRIGNLIVASILSGNRNFEGRIQSQVRANYLASPPLVVAYAIAGKMQVDLTTEPIGNDSAGAPVMLKDIWPTRAGDPGSDARLGQVGDVPRAVRARVRRRRPLALAADPDRRAVRMDRRLHLHPQSAVLRGHHRRADASRPTFVGARALAVLGDSVTTDHISPAGSIPADSPAGKYLMSKGVPPADFNSYGARRGNHEVMMRGTFANIRLRNQLAPGTEGGWTTLLPEGEVMTIYDASVKYRDRGVPLMIVAGKEYGSGSSRDWAAKGTLLLGVKAVLAESFERIHRSNLVNMGVLPLQFRDGETAVVAQAERPRDLRHRRRGRVADARAAKSRCGRRAADGTVHEIVATVRIDTPEELVAFRHGGILPYVLRQLLRQ